MQQEQTLNVARRITRKPNPNTGKVARNPKSALTKRVRAAIDAQIFEGLGRKAAAEKAGLTEPSFYQALRKPVVLAYWNEQLKVLRESTRARNLQRLEEIRDQDENYGAAVRAVQVLEGHGEQGRPGVSVSVNITPGYVMAPPDRSQVIDGEFQRSAQPSLPASKPLIDNDDVG